MSTSNFKKAFALLVAIGMFGTGWSVFRSEAVPQDKPVEKPKPDTKDKPVEKVNPEPKTPPKEGRLKEESINLPKTQAPTQVLASIDKDGKLVVKMAVMVFIPPKQPNPPPGIGGAPMFPARIVVGPPGVMMPFAAWRVWRIWRPGRWKLRRRKACLGVSATNIRLERSRSARHQGKNNRCC